jgi:hypothetical protein
MCVFLVTVKMATFFEKHSHQDSTDRQNLSGIFVQHLLIATFEISAHSRFLSTLQMHPVHPWLLSAAQDGTAAVWALPGNGAKGIGILSSVLWNNRMITGGAFGSGKRQFMLSAYGCSCLKICCML